MGRLRVTPKGKVKKNIPVTRVGKKQYLKRRFAHVRRVDVAGANNHFTQKYFDGSNTAAQNFTRLGLTTDPSAPKSVVELRKKQVRPKSRRRLEEEDTIAEQKALRQKSRIARPISEAEATTIVSLIKKHGTDFRAMSFDRKLNPFQLNPRQLQRQVVNYLRWEQAAFPEAFMEAEAKGWFSIAEYSDPKNRLGKK
ncbi:hypothetical protein C3747_66g78 [Trypanosoma cruzi]|uniref:Nucleolar protein 16 n=3 Tax=Trypanosoma cruzi TaxID=5693 RepID=Q4CZU1_TRYCC|nr:hypothetical protein, conserved [Trypanosoma cruzi]XP_810459.1 hypothetical protein, conserved [Trypanosoma cruzi]ESS67969.1 hypothetical protein TCDM_03277 [Trypanosoma cruzi Dm28c]PBJ77950.1 hypothetical protein BCY84_05355 [Trypanosoma cruzi cruzi]EAN85795.1 hypothetical protein, conserved [Trypanosoma cruzi]EAN88608.1 hypothetical protein, conserved [Trypanosoma cruzi]KAF8287421.1 putative Ribosome biogenesis protein Nop16 [Trypanosoma cruzi]|eukprot:XP_807646.1 hypothetical protein [Trypanosoma cruzi strain CL Brener]